MLIFHAQNVSYKFEQFGDYKVVLRVWNDISESMVLDNISIQETGSVFAVTVDKQTACTDEEVTFKLHVLTGTGVTFALHFSSVGLYVENYGGIFYSSFPISGYHKV